MRSSIFGFLLLCILSTTLTVGVRGAFADETTIEQLQSKIDTKNDRLEAIEKEIKEYESALQEVGAERSTLQSAINTLELEREKVQADIRYTENRIESTDLTIDRLSKEITGTESRIQENEAVVAEMLRRMNSADDESLVELLLGQSTLSDFWKEFEHLTSVRDSIVTHVDELGMLKDTLEAKRTSQTDKRDELAQLKNQFSGQHAVLENNQAEKAELLKETKNEEATYQEMLQEKKAARERLLEEVRAIESELQFILDPNSIPTKGTAVFNWPLKNVILTQYFGYTKFALNNPGVYKGSKHNGIDLGAPTGTSIYAPLSGTVRARGNTDAVPGCYSWGKWILIDHPNGLSTLYAHLSHIGVSNGQQVTTGEVIGYVGNTGYSTGPHLHFTLYASDAVTVKQFNEFKAVTGCGAALSPFSAVEGYLDPLDYLPAV